MGRGTFWGFIFGHAQTCPWPIFSTLFARGSSDAASDYQYSSSSLLSCFVVVVVVVIQDGGIAHVRVQSEQYVMRMML